ncbi:recombinase RecT [Nocardiopsis terrae]|uniref:recombinase RecT n=1 Tax=Streptomyces sp. NPDC057554 TaxID=3350538 RepID=UPI0036C06985
MNPQNNHRGVAERLAAKKQQSQSGQGPQMSGAERRQAAVQEQRQAGLAKARQDLIELAPDIRLALPKVFSPDRMMQLVYTQFRKIPDLVKCDQDTLVGAILTASALGLELGDATGEAYILPRRNYPKSKDQGREVWEATFTLGYKGMVTLFWRHPRAAYLNVETVYENDDFDFWYGLEPGLVHKPAKVGPRQPGRGEPLGYWYAAARMSGQGFAFQVLDKDQVERRRLKSSSPNSPAWKNEYDRMAEKSCLRAMFNMLPKTREVQRALAWDGQARTNLEAAAIDDPPAHDPDRYDPEEPVEVPAGQSRADHEQHSSGGERA